MIFGVEQDKFNEIIRSRRVTLRKSQADLGKVLGITKQSYGALENGKNQFRIDQLKKVCDFLGLKFEDLENQLPAQSKPAMISADEYVKLNNKMMEQQQKIEQLTGQLSEAQQRYNATFYRQKSTVLAFFEYCIDRLKDTYPDYQPDWVAIAKAAKLPDADKFMELYKDFKLAWMEQFIESSDEKDMQAPAKLR